MAAARHFAYAHAKNTRAVDRGGRELGRCLGWLCWCVLIVTDSILTGLKIALTTSAEGCREPLSLTAIRQQV